MEIDVGEEHVNVTLNHMVEDKQVKSNKYLVKITQKKVKNKKIFGILIIVSTITCVAEKTYPWSWTKLFMDK